MSDDLVTLLPSSLPEGEAVRPGSARRVQSRVSFVDTSLAVAAAHSISDVEEEGDVIGATHAARPDSASAQASSQGVAKAGAEGVAAAAVSSSPPERRRASRSRSTSSSARKRGNSSSAPAPASRRARGNSTSNTRTSPQRRPTRRPTTTTASAAAASSQAVARRAASPSSPSNNSTSRSSRTPSPSGKRAGRSQRSASPSNARPATENKANGGTPGSAGSAPRRASGLRGGRGKAQPGITATCLASIDMSILRQNLKPKVKRQRMLNEFVAAYQRGLELFDKEREAELGELFAQFKEASFLPQRHELLRFARYITALREDYGRELALAQAVARAAMDGAARCLMSVHASGEALCLHTGLLDPSSDYHMPENCARDEAHYGRGRPMPEVRSRGPAGAEEEGAAHGSGDKDDSPPVLHRAQSKAAAKESQEQAATIAACFTAPLAVPSAEVLSRLSLLPPLAELVRRHRAHDQQGSNGAAMRHGGTSAAALSPPSTATTVAPVQPATASAPATMTTTNAAAAAALRNETSSTRAEEESLSLAQPLADDQSYVVQERAKSWQARMARVEDVVQGFGEVKTALDALLARMQAQDAHQRRLIARQKRALDEAATRVKLADDILTGSRAQADESACFAIARLRELSAELRGRMDGVEDSVRQTLQELSKDSATICVENGVLASEATVAYRREACVQACRSKLERGAIEQAAVMRAVQDFVVELWRGTARVGREEKATLRRRALPAEYEAVLRADCDRDTLLRLIEHVCVQSDAALRLTLGALDEQTHFLQAHPTEAAAVRRREAMQRAVTALLERLDAEHLFAVGAAGPSGVPLSLPDKVMELVRNYEALVHNVRPASAASTIDVGNEGEQQQGGGVSPRRAFFDRDTAVPAEARAAAEHADEQLAERRKKKGSVVDQPAPRLAFNPALLTLPCVVTASGTQRHMGHKPGAPMSSLPAVPLSSSPSVLPAMSARGGAAAPCTNGATTATTATHTPTVATAHAEDETPSVPRASMPSCPSPTQVRAYLRRGHPSLQSPTQGGVSVVGVGRWDGFAPHTGGEAAWLTSTEPGTGARSAACCRSVRGRGDATTATGQTSTVASHGSAATKENYMTAKSAACSAPQARGALTRAMARQAAAHTAGPAPSLPLRKHLIAHVQREYQHDRDAIVAGAVEPTPAEATKKEYHNEDYYYIDRQRELYRVLFD